MTFCTTPCIFGSAVLRTTRRRRPPELSREWGEGGGEGEEDMEGEVINVEGRISENDLGAGPVDSSTDRFLVVSNNCSKMLGA
jgi:hypothetical protein